MNIFIKILRNLKSDMEKELESMEKVQINIEENQKEIKKHGNYSFPVEVSIETIQSYEQGSFLWHWHPEIELTWIMSGAIEYHVNNQSYILTEGEGLFGNSNTLHSGYMKDGQECTYLSVTFHPRFLYGYENSILQTKYIDFITSNDSWSSLKLEKHVEWHQEVLSHMKNLYRLSLKKTADYELAVHIMLMQIFGKLYHYFSNLPEKERQPQKHLQRLRDIISFLQDNYSQDVTLDDVAAHVSICKSECCRFFKKHMNMTIFEYLLFLRVQNSLAFLKKGESITKTASLVGFSSPAYYGQIFKRHMKCTPKEYRDSITN